jgi:hypothetical protein
MNSRDVRIVCPRPKGKEKKQQEPTNIARRCDPLTDGRTGQQSQEVQHVLTLLKTRYKIKIVEGYSTREQNRSWDCANTKKRQSHKQNDTVPTAVTWKWLSAGMCSWIKPEYRGSSPLSDYTASHSDTTVCQTPHLGTLNCSVDIQGFITGRV